MRQRWGRPQLSGPFLSGSAVPARDDRPRAWGEELLLFSGDAQAFATGCIWPTMGLGAMFTELALLAHFEDGAPDLTDLIRACDDSFLPRAINMLPIGLSWKSQPDVTLSGDAAHLMSPFAGESANQAMLDGAELAEELLATRDPSAAIKAYEAKMFARTQEAAEESARNLELCIGPDSARRLAKQMAIYQSAE